jgi:hypothetical protein
MATPAPETSCGPLAGVTILAVVTLRQDNLPVCFNFYNDFGEKGEFENRL